MENLENLDFQYFLNEKIRERGLNLKRLAEISGIAVKHLEALSAGNFSNIPPAPYLRGYLQKLGQILNFEPEMWWVRLKEGGFIKDSMAIHDARASAKFTKLSAPKITLGGIIVLAATLYVLLQLSRIFGKPLITITYPTQNPASATSSEITVTGMVKNNGSLYLNGEQVPLNKDGSWEKTVLLQSGINSIEVKAKKFLGGETKIIEQIIYEPATASGSRAVGSNP